jgi:hypothetical protein
MNGHKNLELEKAQYQPPSSKAPSSAKAATNLKNGEKIPQPPSASRLILGSYIIT